MDWRRAAASAANLVTYLCGHVSYRDLYGHDDPILLATASQVRDGSSQSGLAQTPPNLTPKPIPRVESSPRPCSYAADRSDRAPKYSIYRRQGR